MIVITKTLIFIVITFHVSAEFVTKRNLDNSDASKEITTSADASGKYILLTGAKVFGLGEVFTNPIHITEEYIQKDKQFCSLEGDHLRPYINDIRNGVYSDLLKNAVRGNNDGLVELALHYCRNKNNIPTVFPEQFQVLDSEEIVKRNDRFPAGTMAPHPEDEFPNSHLEIIDGHGFQSKNCKDCHMQQFDEWSSSAHARAAVDIGFNLFEKTLREANQATYHKGRGPHGGEEPTTQFCVRCHVGVGFEDREDLGPVDINSDKFVAEELSEEESNGISCLTCHTKSGKYVSPDPQTQIADREKGILGDGLANASLKAHYESHLGFGSVIYGPYQEDEINAPHASRKWEFESSSQLCLGCHDVRFAKDDTKSGEPFQRLENLGSEHLDYKAKGGEHSCVDCHMTQDPNCEPGVTVSQPISSVSGNIRKRTNHGFLGVTVPLQTHKGRFPQVDSENINRNGMKQGREQLRACLLQRAAEIIPEKKNQKVEINDDGSATLKLRPTIENIGAGHGIPSGFSQEREVWVKLSVKDDKGNEVYKSGYTWGDIQGQEREKWAKKLGFPNVEEFNKVVNNEDLAHEFVILDPVTLEATHLSDPKREKLAKKYGINSLEEFNSALKNNNLKGYNVLTPTNIINLSQESPETFNQILNSLNLENIDQLITYLKNAEYVVLSEDKAPEVIYRTGKVQHGPDYPHRKEKDKEKNGLRIYTNQFIRERHDGEDELVFSAHLADHMNNTESLKPGIKEEIKYDIEVDPEYKGQYHVELSLNYRPYPPHFFKALVEGEKLRAQRQGRTAHAGETEYHNAIKSVTMNSLHFSVDSHHLAKAKKMCRDNFIKKLDKEYEVDFGKRDKIIELMEKSCKSGDLSFESPNCVMALMELSEKHDIKFENMEKLNTELCSEDNLAEQVMTCMEFEMNNQGDFFKNLKIENIIKKCKKDFQSEVILLMEDLNSINTPEKIKECYNKE
ncbi:MAG: multiheme c-type cytochrome [Bdellovibrionota bacterium]|nr:multiheme c-type cytochrome [Bdellovibrionota bacterium]